jgi:hypothetical protein
MIEIIDSIFFLIQNILFNTNLNIIFIFMSVNQKLNILLFSGSLRKASTNTGLLRAIVEIGHPKLNF